MSVVAVEVVFGPLPGERLGAVEVVFSPLPGELLFIMSARRPEGTAPSVAFYPPTPTFPSTEPMYSTSQQV